MSRINIYGYVDNRADDEKIMCPFAPKEPLVHIIGNREADFGDSESLSLSLSEARLVAMAMINAVERVENGFNYNKVIESTYERDSDDMGRDYDREAIEFAEQNKLDSDNE